MPYASDAELPSSVRKSLPRHGQDIYREAFNHAWDEYDDPSKRRDPGEDREAIAHKVAWSAVEQKYHKKGEKWVRHAS